MKNNYYEYDKKGLNNSATISQQNLEKNEEKKIPDKKFTSNYLMVQPIHFNQQIDEESDEEYGNDSNLQSFQKLKSLERRSTPQNIKRAKLESKRSIQIKKSSTELVLVEPKDEPPKKLK